MNFSLLCNCNPFPISALIFFLNVHLTSLNGITNNMHCTSTISHHHHPASLHLCKIDQSFQSISSCFPTRTEAKTLLNPHGVATAERNSLTYQGQFLSVTRNLSALMYCNYILLQLWHSLNKMGVSFLPLLGKITKESSQDVLEAKGWLKWKIPLVLHRPLYVYMYIFLPVYILSVVNTYIL